MADDQIRLLVLFLERRFEPPHLDHSAATTFNFHFDLFHHRNFGLDVESFETCFLSRGDTFLVAHSTVLLVLGLEILVKCVEPLIVQLVAVSCSFKLEGQSIMLLLEVIEVLGELGAAPPAQWSTTSQFRKV